MGIVQKLKNLHKQTLLKLSSIGRVVVADEAGVNNGKYLNRAKNLDNYIDRDNEGNAIYDFDNTVNFNEKINF